MLVVGSGPGGAVTACTLAEAGREVLVVEEGGYLEQDSCAPFSTDEMESKYRNGGLTMAMGTPKVVYVEGRCAGGGSEINSGLYHRTPPEVLARWQTGYQVRGLETDLLDPIFEQCERDISVSYLDTPPPAASLKLHQGARKLGWKSLEVPRWFAKGERQSMTRTFLPRAFKAGARMLPNGRILQLHPRGRRWVALGRVGEDRRVRIEADVVFVCGGAVQTPALLRRSGFRGNVGRNLQLHATVKVIAEFPDVVNARDMGVPVHQVKEFSPKLSFGGSISSLPYLALAMTDHPNHLARVPGEWERMASYYVMLAPEGRGSIRCVPGLNDPIVRFKLTGRDLENLADGCRKLCQILLEAGATSLFPSIRGGPVINSASDLTAIPVQLPTDTSNLMTIHLFSSCAMGENSALCATNSFGKVHGAERIFVADASLLCTSLGANPQGSVMAIAKRNALHFLGQL